MEEIPDQVGHDEPETVSASAVIAGSDRQSPEEETEPWERLQVGDIGIHKSLGPGEVMSLDDKYLIVKFPDRESKFLYPSAFEKGYLLVW